MLATPAAPPGIHLHPAVPSSTPYDDVPYASQAFAQTHPDRLATLARVFGLAAPAVESCRVLELGCAAGGNLIPMAHALPGGEFVGVDLSARQVAQGRQRVQALGLRNVRIEHASILDIDAGWGRFDYIVCHGVFSWVERDVQDKILHVAAQQLHPEGVAYVSYNTYPGWHMRESVRHMMRYHAMPFEEPQERIAQARALLDFLAGAVPQEGNAYGQMLAGELDLLRRCADWYLFHEHLEPTNTPLYFHQFAERAAGCGLQYLAEADFAAMLTARFPPPVAQTLERISADIVHLEQYMDFVRNRHFRQTLLCRAGRQPRRALSPAVMAGLHVASAARPDAPHDGPGGPDLRPGVPATFRVTGRAQAATAHPLSKAAFGLLAQHWPLGLPLHDLLAQARQRAAPHLQAGSEAEDERTVMQDLFQCFLSGLVELRSWQPPCVARAGERPRATAYAVAQNADEAVVTGLRHEVVTLAPFSRALLPLLDGTRTRADLQGALLEQVAAGRLPLPQQAVVPADPAALAAAVAHWVEESLASLARHALLVA
jgi:methyltransferase-like protein/2-polyprenyl-3-methyl-5-hydroxy-6-metoxy-1,4-benzoquinol methylase